MNIIQVFKQFPTQEACVKHLEQARWGDKPICAYCGSTNTYPLKGELRHHCNDCRRSFSVTVGTIFHDSRLPLQKWFLAISLVLNAKKGISARQLARDIEVNKDTAWSMGMRIREAMQDDGALLSGIIEMDETYVGGKQAPATSYKKKQAVREVTTETKESQIITEAIGWFETSSQETEEESKTAAGNGTSAAVSSGAFEHHSSQLL